jgi:IPT/TIG domain/Putative Ig domain
MRSSGPSSRKGCQDEVDHRGVSGQLRPPAARRALNLLVVALASLAAVGAAESPSGASEASPVITSMAPDFGSTSGGTVVTIHGTGLGKATSVDFGALKAKVKSDSATSITAVAPAEGAGTVYVLVDTPVGDSADVAASSFTFVDADPGTVTIVPQYTTESCAGNIDTASWVPPSGVHGLTGFYVMEEEFTDEGPQFFDYNLGPDQASMPASVVNGQTEVLVFTVTSAGVSSEPFGGAEVVGYGIPTPMQWADEGDNSVSDRSTTVTFEWPGPPQSSITGGDVAADTVEITESDGATQNFPASTDGVTATYPDLIDGDQYTYTDTVSDVCGTSQVSQLSPVFVPGVVPTLSGTPSLGIVGDPYTYTFAIGGDPAPDLSVTSGQLPPGLTLGSDGILSGTPTTPGNYDVMVTAQNDVGIEDFTTGTAADSFEMTVDAAPSITSADTTTFVAGEPGAFTVESAGFPTPSLSETGALPAGLDFDVEPGGTASISGTPQAGTNGVYPIAITASNGVAPSAAQDFELIVGPAITSPEYATTIVASPFTFEITTAGPGFESISESGKLPSGLYFYNDHDGGAHIAGTPEADSGGTYHDTITAKFDVGGTVQTIVQHLTLVIDQPLQITSPAHFTLHVGEAFRSSVTTVGFPGATNITEIGALPDGISFDYAGGSAATLSGLPDAGTEGVYSVTLQATNDESGSAVQTLTLVVKR